MKKLSNNLRLYPVLFLVIVGYLTHTKNKSTKGGTLMNITEAVIPAAGLGTRFLPFTKAVPKEMLPLVDKPAIQNIIEEGLLSNITNFFIIANKDKQAIIDHFSPQPKLEATLKNRNKEHLLASVNKIINSAQFDYLEQPKPLGLGHAILMAKPVIKNEYFGVLLPDDIIDSQTPALNQLITIAQKHNASVIAVQEVPKDKVSSYGVIAIKEQLGPNLYEVEALVEKPPADQAPSNLAIIGRYILSLKVFDSLETIKPGSGNEIQLTDGIADMMQKGERVLAYKIDGIRHDLGKPEGWLKANICFAMKNPTYSPTIRSLCSELITSAE